jgi:hypothetical protein
VDYETPMLCLKSSFLRYLLDGDVMYVPSFSSLNILDLLTFYIFDTLRHR